jgi:hypothetical protein
MGQWATAENRMLKYGASMTINEFARQVAKGEGKKKQENIAQIKEQLKVVNQLLGGSLYKLIRAL